MSLLIKNVEMPTDHPLWIVVHPDGTVEANEVSASRPVGWQTLRDAAAPVPPHGRLGDLEALAEDVEIFADENAIGKIEKEELLEIVKYFPTIIPSDANEEKGETK